MNLNDIQYITEIAKSGSINKAAKELFVSQPSLSKCIRKVEKEFNVEIFQRSKGSTMKLTREGECFVEMAERMLDARWKFEENIKKLRLHNKSSILFGTTRQRGYDILGDVLKFLYENYKQYFIEVKTRGSVELKRELLEEDLDIILMNESTEDKRLFYEHLFPTSRLIYLRRGSPAAQKAVFMEGYDYPVLRLEDLTDETIVVNESGSESRNWLEQMQKKLQIRLKLEEISNYNNRMVMVENGQATYIFLGEAIGRSNQIDRSLLYLLHPQQNVRGNLCLVCRKGYERDPRFQAMAECMHHCYKNGEN